jgi:hypothetical protein
MNLADIYSARLHQKILVEIYIYDSVVEQVRIHTKPVEELIQDLIEFWEGTSYDPETNDSQIWDSSGKLLWSYYNDYYVPNSEEEDDE